MLPTQDTTLILTRHGETLENQQNILQGQLPGTLSPLGIQQAEALAGLLKDEPLDVIVSSDLARSFETALAVARLHHLVPQQTPLLREMDWGAFTGGRLDHLDWHHLPESVESLEALYSRAKEFIRHLRTNYPGKKILAVGHGAFNRAIVVYLENLPVNAMIDMPIMANTACLRYML